MTKVVSTGSSDETDKLGRAIGKALKGGETIELVSDLGGGKTTFVRGIVAGAGSKDLVSSPTFTISNVYDAGKFQVYHFDFYRLPEAGLMEHDLADVLGEADRVVVVEWSDVVAHVLPAKRLSVQIASSGDDKRKFRLTYPKELAYLVEKL